MLSLILQNKKATYTPEDDFLKPARDEPEKPSRQPPYGAAARTEGDILSGLGGNIFKDLAEEMQHDYRQAQEQEAEDDEHQEEDELRPVQNASKKVHFVEEENESKYSLSNTRREQRSSEEEDAGDEALHNAFAKRKPSS